MLDGAESCAMLAALTHDDPTSMQGNKWRKKCTKLKSGFGFPRADAPRPVPEIPKLFLCAAIVSMVTAAKVNPRLRYVGEQGQLGGEGGHGKESDRVMFNATE